LRFPRSAWELGACPECGESLEPLERAELAMGLPLFVDRGDSLPGLDAAIAAVQARSTPPKRPVG
jgi:hypothetical protein